MSKSNLHHEIIGLSKQIQRHAELLENAQLRGDTKGTKIFTAVLNVLVAALEDAKKELGDE